MTRDGSNNTMTPSNGTKRKCRIQAAGGGAESEIEDTSVKIAVKRKRSRMTGRKITMFAETPTKAYIHKVSNFTAVQEAWV